MINVIVVDDQPIFRRGIRSVLASVDGFDLTGEAACGSELIELLRQSRPDVVIMDMHTPGICGIDLIARIHHIHPLLPILVLSMLDEPPIVTGAIKAGAHGYITKHGEIKEMLVALHKVASGGKYVAQEIAEHMLFDNDLDKGPYGALTDRERSVLNQLVVGKNSKEIADTLCISNKTVSTHKMNLLEKMHMKNTAELVKYAMVNGLLA